jgi:hypothetical protein
MNDTDKDVPGNPLHAGQVQARARAKAEASISTVPLAASCQKAVAARQAASISPDRSSGP